MCFGKKRNQVAKHCHINRKFNPDKNISSLSAFISEKTSSELPEIPPCYQHLLVPSKPSEDELFLKIQASSSLEEVQELFTLKLPVESSKKKGYVNYPTQKEKKRLEKEYCEKKVALLYGTDIKQPLREKNDGERSFQGEISVDENLKSSQQDKNLLNNLAYKEPKEGQDKMDKPTGFSTNIPKGNPLRPSLADNSHLLEMKLKKQANLLSIKKSEPTDISTKKSLIIKNTGKEQPQLRANQSHNTINQLQSPDLVESSVKPKMKQELGGKSTRKRQFFEEPVMRTKTETRKECDSSNVEPITCEIEVQSSSDPFPSQATQKKENSHLNRPLMIKDPYVISSFKSSPTKKNRKKDSPLNHLSC
ncbi:hypothetical protein G9A89_007373 [Geosiphon pyriformis]|nr:hypothetical protein G9A89_007373 [Geosiphon pyriformis]